MTHFNDQSLQKKAEVWLGDGFDPKTRRDVKRLIEKGGADLSEAFYQDLEFGTGGIRGITGVGTHRINRYTLGKATQGLVNYLLQTHTKTCRVAIAYDSRNSGETLAKSISEVFSAHAFEVYLFESLRPTPELSFAVRHLKCQAGIVITASHNPKEYNGYKVYLADGGQIVPPHDREIIEAVRQVSFSEIRFDPELRNISYIGKAVDEAYIDTCLQVSGSTGNSKKTTIVYTALHGSGAVVMPTLMKRAGFHRFTSVAQQASPDGNFPTVKTPNPEEQDALKMALTLGEHQNADVVFGTDPDADRVGFAVRNAANKLELLNGNQAAALMMDYVLSQRKTYDIEPFVASTVVTSELLLKISAHYGIRHERVLTGFKWIGELIEKHRGKRQFICGGEESYGFLVGDRVRDKDAMISALVFCEMAEAAHQRGETVWDRLQNIYRTHGLYRERLISLHLPGREGAERIAQTLKNYRAHPPQEISGIRVQKICDFQTSTAQNTDHGTVEKLNLPPSNVLIYYLSDGTQIALRPSGTEPKMKCYLSVWENLTNSDAIATTEALERKMDRIAQDFLSL